MAAIFNQPHYQDAEKAREYLEALRWANGVTCPHCASLGKHLHLTGTKYRPGLYKCADCYEQFTVTVGTVFERSKVPLHLWLQAVHLMCASKKGISAKQVERMLGVTYKTAWFMCHRIREAMTSKPGGLLGNDGGAVEADETFWGSASKDDGTKATKKRGGYYHKMKVLSLVDRNSGEKRSFHVAAVNAATLGPILKAQISTKARLVTDEAAQYRAVASHFASHQHTSHANGEYVRGDVHSNTVESSFAILKRGLYGTFHSVSEKHLQRYANEFDFRWNTRISQGFNDTMRTDQALLGIAGKRLTYRRTDKEGASIH